MKPPPEDPYSPLGWAERIIRVAQSLDNATTGSVAAATGMSAVLGMVGSGLFWMPFAGGASLLIYRVIKSYDERAIRRARHDIEIQAMKRIELEAIAKAKLPQSQKELLAESLDKAVDQPKKDSRLLNE